MVLSACHLQGNVDQHQQTQEKHTCKHISRTSHYQALGNYFLIGRGKGVKIMRATFRGVHISVINIPEKLVSECDIIMMYIHVNKSKSTRVVTIVHSYYLTTSNNVWACTRKYFFRKICRSKYHV